MSKTQLERVRGKLKERGFITRNQCLTTVPAITRLSAIIQNLEEEGFVFTTKHERGDYVYKVVSYPEVKTLKIL